MGGGNPYANQSLAQNTQQGGTAAGSTYASLLGGNGQGPLAQTNLSPYMNPYLNNVVGSTMNELNRQETIQGNSLADQATKQNAFGGDRFAIQMAENNRNFDNTRANALGQLYNTGFNTAQGAAQQDINNRMNAASGLGSMANMGFGWGNQLQQNQLAAGAMQQQQQQSIMDAIKNQFLGFTGQGTTGLNNMISALMGMYNPTQSHSSGSGSSMQFGLPSGK